MAVARVLPRNSPRRLPRVRESGRPAQRWTRGEDGLHRALHSRPPLRRVHHRRRAGGRARSERLAHRQGPRPPPRRGCDRAVGHRAFGALATTPMSSVDRPVLHHLLLPATDAQQRPYSSSLPYRAGAQRFIVGALPHPDSPPRAPADRRRHRSPALPARRGDADGPLHAGGRAARRAALPSAADALRFLPLTAGGGLEPVGVRNEMRRYAYPMSQWTWARTRHDGARLQREAERLGPPSSRPCPPRP
jgi:hypothetical protein